MPPLADPNEESLTRWFREEVLIHQEALRAYIRSAFPSVADPENLVQEAFARIFQARRSGVIPSPRGYLYACVRHAAIDALRQKKIISFESLTEIQASSVIDDGPSVPDTVGLRLDLEVLTEAIQSLPDRCRQVLTLRKIYGLSQREIAERLGISENTVETQIAVGMKRCAEFLRRRGLLKERQNP